MQIFTFHDEVWLPHARDDVFAFFANATNLDRITPTWLNFHIITPLPILVRQGTLIDYKLKIYGFPVYWQTEIVGWSPPNQFTDVQPKGPYSLWEHTHTFVQRRWGIICIDHVRYHPTGGRLTHALFVRRQIEQIFAYRRSTLVEIFPE